MMLSMPGLDAISPCQLENCVNWEIARKLEMSGGLAGTDRPAIDDAELIG